MATRFNVSVLAVSLESFVRTRVTVACLVHVIMMECAPAQGRCPTEQTVNITATVGA